MQVKGFSNEPFGPARLEIEYSVADVGAAVIFDEVAVGVVDRSTGHQLVPLPADLYGKPGRHEVYLRGNGRESNRLEFRVEP